MILTRTDSVDTSIPGERYTPFALAKKLGATQIDEHANTDDPSYFKKTGKTSTLLVGSAAEVFLGNWIIKYQSAVACQIAK